MIKETSISLIICICVVTYHRDLHIMEHNMSQLVTVGHRKTRLMKDGFKDAKLGAYVETFSHKYIIDIILL